MFFSIAKTTVAFAMNPLQTIIFFNQLEHITKTLLLKTPPRYTHLLHFEALFGQLDQDMKCMYVPVLMNIYTSETNLMRQLSPRTRMGGGLWGGGM